MTCKFATIGLGKVGGSMHRLLSARGFSPVWAVSSREHPDLEQVRTEIPADPGNARLVFLGVPDGAISTVARDLASRWGSACRDITFLHFSGALGAEILVPLAEQGGRTASFHPLQSLIDADRAAENLPGSVFTVEGDAAACGVARQVAEALGGTVREIAPEDKLAYHTAAVIASNYLVSLAHQAGELFAPLGLEASDLLPLIRGTVDNLADRGTSALTGPVQRGDWKTVSRHVEMLRETYPDILPSYEALGRYTARVAGREWPRDLPRGPKVLSWQELGDQVAKMRRRGMRVVFTNGCFDILHAGHVAYLEEARRLGDCLVVGLNADASVRRLKGPERPVNEEGSRAAVLAGLGAVDYVTVFAEDTPLKLIETLVPDVLVKGGDWRIEDIVGGDVVSAAGGEVCTIQFKEGHSTTSIVEKIKHTAQ